MVANMAIKETEKLQVISSKEHKSKIKSEWKTIGIRVRNEELPLLNKQLDGLNYVTMGVMVDASAPSFIRALKLQWQERSDYDDRERTEGLHES